MVTLTVMANTNGEMETLMQENLKMVSSTVKGNGRKRLKIARRSTIILKANIVMI